MRRRVRHAARRATVGRTLVLVLAAFALGGEALAGTDSAKQHAKIARKTAKDMDRLWRTAKFKKLDAEADALAELIVHFAPEHEAAREWLGHVREGDGWRVPDKPKARKNRTERGLSAQVKKRATKAAAAVKTLWRLYEEAADHADQEARDFILTDIARLAPDDERLATEQTVYLEDGFWLTTDVRRLARMNTEIQKVRVPLLRALPDSEAIPLLPALEKASSLTWKSSLKVGDVPVWGTCSKKEADVIGQACLVAAQLFAFVFKRKRVLPSGFGVVVVTTREERARLVRELGLGARRAGSGAFDLPNSGVVVTARWQGWDVRMDSAVRMLIYQLYKDAFGIGRESAWAAQAVSVALTWYTTTTRLTVMGAGREDHDERERHLERVLFDGESGWVPPARDVANEGALPDVTELAPQSRGQIYVRDLLSCYAYGLYIMSIRNEHAAEIFSRLGRSEPAGEVVCEVLGFETPESLHAHITRWLNDDAPYEEGKSRRVRASRPIPR